MTFTYEQPTILGNMTYELVPSGSDKYVTSENKKEFVKLFCEAVLVKTVKPQLQAFLKGFFTILPNHFFSGITPVELGTII
mmetsp:Transcript_27536/g.24241  ORF Transcript_27536/g.24241 Transcript_27536/m.24241 type:complete len:81 (+) Transcript_27536:418-660(+)